MRLSWKEKKSSDGFRYSQPVNAETGEEVDNVILTSVEVGIDKRATMTFTVRLDSNDDAVMAKKAKDSLKNA